MSNHNWRCKECGHEFISKEMNEEKMFELEEKSIEKESIEKESIQREMYFKALLDEILTFIQLSYINGTDIFEEMECIMKKVREIRDNMSIYPDCANCNQNGSLYCAKCIEMVEIRKYFQSKNKKDNK